MKRTMRVLCLLLMFTTLATAGFFTPKPKDDEPSTTVLKQGHEGVKVEFEKDDGNTKVFISPQDDHDHAQAHDDGGEKDATSHLSRAKEKLSDAIEGTEEKLKEASSGEENEEETTSHVRFSPRELVCDAYGKCKHKIASTLGQTKEAVKETVQEAADKVHEVEEEAKDVLSQTTDKVTRKAREASEKARDVRESAKDKAGEVEKGLHEKSKEAMEDAARKAYDMAHDAKESVGEKAGKVKEDAKEHARRGAEQLGQKGKKGFRLILHRTANVFSYIVPWKAMASVTGVLHLLGFSVAYGTSLWVTFASSYVLAGVLPRQQFAMVQSKIYPLYFKAMASSIGLAMLGHLMGPRKLFSSISMGMLGSSLVMTLANSLFLEPRATKVMFERMKKEKEEGSAKQQGEETEPVGGPVVTRKGPTSAEAAPLEKGEAVCGDPKTTKAEATLKGTDSDRLRRLNSYSSILNVATLGLLTWHLVYLGKNLHSVC